MHNSSRRILITGASGFIGGHLYSKFKKKGSKIKRLRKEDWPNVNKIVKLFRPTEIYHFAAYGNSYDQQNVFKTYKANLSNLLNLLHTTNKINYKVFVNIGSSSEYGMKNASMNEANILEPTTYYASSKAAGTLLARVWALKEGKPIVTVRPFTVTGIGEQENHLIPTLIRSCLLQEKMKFVPEPIHDFIDVDDLISGILLVAKNAKKYPGEVFNIGNGKQYSNLEVKRIVEKITGKKASVELTESLRSYDTPTMWVADNSKIRRLGWKPRKKLEKSIKEMVNYFKKEKQ